MKPICRTATSICFILCCRKMPGGGSDKVFCLDMAHMDLGALSISTVASPVGSPRVSPPHSPKHAADAAAISSADISIRSGRRYSAYGEGSKHSVRNSAGGKYGDTAGTDADEGTQHSTMSYASSLQRAASMGDVSTHLTSMVGVPDIPTTSKLRKTLSLKKEDGGLVVGKYILEANDASSGARTLQRSSSMGARVAHAAAAAGQLLSNMKVGSAAAHARSVHAGRAFFDEAAAGSVHGRWTGLGVVKENKTVHGGTAHAAGKLQKTGIFYQG